jgi:hypothetical protein
MTRRYRVTVLTSCNNDLLLRLAPKGEADLQSNPVVLQ